MYPSAPQLAPRMFRPFPSASGIGAPPDIETFISFRSARKPSHRLSGEKKGIRTSMLSSMSWLSRVSRARK